LAEAHIYTRKSYYGSQMITSSRFLLTQHAAIFCSSETDHEAVWSLDHSFHGPR